MALAQVLPNVSVSTPNFSSVKSGPHAAPAQAPGNGQKIPGNPAPAGIPRQRSGGSSAQASMFSMSQMNLTLEASISMSQVLAQQTQTDPQQAGNTAGVSTSALSSQALNVNLTLSLDMSSLQMSSMQVGNMTGSQLGSRIRGAGQQVGRMLNASSSSFNFHLGLDMSMSSLSASSIDSLAQGLDDLELDPATKEMLGGYLALLENLMEDDEQIGKFVQQIKQTLSNLFSQGGSAPAQEGAAEGQATVAQANAVSLNMEVNIHGEVVQITQVNAKQEKEADPLVLDLDGDGVELSTATDGVQFDVTGDGVAEQTAFVTGGDGLLVLDRNGNGTIDSGRELFGDQHGAANGFTELKKFDGNADGVIDSKDDVFDQLQVWVEQNNDGVSQSTELFSLTQLNIQSINLAAADTDQSASGGNRITQVGSYTRTDGSQGQAVDAMFNYVA